MIVILGGDDNRPLAQRIAQRLFGFDTSLATLASEAPNAALLLARPGDNCATFDPVTGCWVPLPAGPAN